MSAWVGRDSRAFTRPAAGRCCCFLPFSTAALAERQFNRVDPDYRLVAAEFERRWEAALSEVLIAEEALARSIVQLVMGKALNDMPIPSGLVEWNASKIRSIAAGEGWCRCCGHSL